MKYKLVGGLNIFSGIVEIIQPLVMLLVVVPSVMPVYDAFEAQPNLIITYLVLGIVILVGIANVFCGIKLFSKSKERYFNAAIVFLLISWALLGFASAVSVYSTMAPIYNLTGSM